MVESFYRVAIMNLGPAGFDDHFSREDIFDSTAQGI